MAADYSQHTDSDVNMHIAPQAHACFNLHDLDTDMSHLHRGLRREVMSGHQSS